MGQGKSTRWPQPSGGDSSEVNPQYNDKVAA